MKADRRPEDFSRRWTFSDTVRPRLAGGKQTRG